jgi:hypothetical protein
VRQERAAASRATATREAATSEATSLAVAMIEVAVREARAHTATSRAASVAARAARTVALCCSDPTPDLHANGVCDCVLLPTMRKNMTLRRILNRTLRRRKN